ncbi:GtrA family protein [Pseudanabaena sp. BC1403]|uniref:GtrA family protein n=1 Tax=Pseudanabaena sp. BC1403 TaxID=2043171 RepID=UPI000CD8BC65
MSIVKSTISKIKNNTFVSFLFVGGINTLFGYTIFSLLVFVRLEYRLALLIATVCGIFFNFKTVGTLVFKTRNNRLIIRFIIVYLLTYLINVGVLKITNSLGINLFLSQALLVLPLACFSYFLNKQFVFDSRNK